MAAVSDAWVNRRDEVLEQSARLTEAISRAIPTADALPAEEALAAAYRDIVGFVRPDQRWLRRRPQVPPTADPRVPAPHPPSSRGQSGERRCCAGPSTKWPTAGSTTSSEVASPGTRWTTSGWSPISRKCSTTTPNWPGSTSGPGIELDEPRFIEVARSTLDYLLTDLHHPDGGFYSAEDADSEGVEGKFYVWTLSELTEVLGEEDATEAARFFGASRHGNFEGSNILYRPTREPWTDRIESIRKRLLEARAAGSGPGSTTRWSPPGTAWRSERWPRPAPHWRRATTWRQRSEPARFLVENLIADGVGDEVLAPGPGPGARVPRGLRQRWPSASSPSTRRPASSTGTRCERTLASSIPTRFGDPGGRSLRHRAGRGDT